jgi:hypothetical protein
MRSLLLLACLMASASGSHVVKLTEDNFYAETNDKTVFLKMFAPWVSFMHIIGRALELVFR